MEKTSSWLSLLLAVAGVALCVAGVLLLLLSLPSLASRADGSDGPPVGPRERVEALCEANQTVVEQMPRHPDSRRVLDEAVSIWREETDLEERAALDGLAVAFKDSPLGLSALDAYLKSGDGEAFCKSLLQEHPDSRVACMALDHLLARAPDHASPLLDKIVATKPETRVGVFALVRLGDAARDAGDFRLATRHWLEAWLAAPDRGPSLFNRLCLAWTQLGDWHYPLLMPSELHDDPVLDPVKRYALAQLDLPEAAAAAACMTTLREAGNALALNDIRAAVASLRPLLDRPLNKFSAEDRAYVGTSVFMLGSNKDYTVTLDIRNSLEMKHAFTRCRHDFLAWAQSGFDALPPDLRSVYAIRLAHRFLQDTQVPPAMKLLETTWRDPSVPQPWRERVVDAHVTVLLEERGDHREAGRVYGAYCDAVEQAPPLLRVKAANLLYQAAEYAESLGQLDKLDAASGAEGIHAAQQFLRGLNYVRQGEEPLAKETLAAVFADHPQSEFAPQALNVLARIALADQEYEEAEAYLEDLVTRYPESPGVETAEHLLSQIQNRPAEVSRR